MNDPKISIIIPIYNAEIYLHECLNSVVNQSLKEIEIICVVDGATDDSLNIVQKYALEYEQVKVITQKNSGVSVARNNGLKAARAPYIMFVDSDDSLSMHACETAYRAMVENDADAVIYSCAIEYAGKSFPKFAFGQDKRFFDEQAVFYILYRRCFGLTADELDIIEQQDYISSVCLKLYKRNLIENNDLEFVDINDIGSYEDGFFNLKYFAVATSAVYLPDVLYHYRRDNAESNTSRYKEKLEGQWETLFSRMKKEIKDHELPEMFVQAFNNRIALSIIGLGINILQSDYPFWKKVNMIKAVITRKNYADAMQLCKMKKMKPHWKVFFYCVRYKFSFGVMMLLMTMNKLRRR